MSSPSLKIPGRVYLVGGAVRDALLGLPVTDRDWLVVGSTPEAMIAGGFRQVGRDFPVFLHPVTGEEYALARRERKVATGHRGFVCDFGPEVSVEEDLLRRDLTVNALAQAVDGELIDPSGGRSDLKNRVLRHVSDAFSEDPLRVFRCTRFATRFAALGFQIHPDTLRLMQKMAKSDELGSLSAERVWGETLKALQTPMPIRFFHDLAAARALKPWFEELVALTDKSGSLPEKSLPCLAACTELSTEQKFAALGLDLASRQLTASTTTESADHPAERLALRLGVPRNFRDLARISRRWLDGLQALESFYDDDGHQAEAAERLLDSFEQADLFRKPDRFVAMLEVISRHPEASGTLVKLNQLARDCCQPLLQIKGRDFLAQGLEGQEVPKAIRRARLNCITDILCKRS